MARVFVRPVSVARFSKYRSTNLNTKMSVKVSQTNQYFFEDTKHVYSAETHVLENIYNSDVITSPLSIS